MTKNENKMAEDNENMTTAAMKDDTVTVTCCAECPFLTGEPGCGENEEAGIDREFIDDDVSALCPMLDGSSRWHEGRPVKLAEWIYKNDGKDIDD